MLIKVKVNTFALISFIGVLAKTAVAVDDGCQYGWKKFEDQCFFSDGVKRNANSCESFCNSKSKFAMMYCPYSKEMDEFIAKEYTTSIHERIWIGLEDYNGGYLRPTDARCSSTYRNLDHDSTVSTDCIHLHSAVSNGEPWRTSGSGCRNFQQVCVCQAPNQAEIKPRGSCAKQDGPCYSDCIEQDNQDPTCWDAMFANQKHQINNEYLLAGLQDLADHEKKVATWKGGKVTSILSEEENDFMVAREIGNTLGLHFTSKSEMTYEECKNFCYAQGGTTPCIDSDETNQLVSKLGDNMWLGVATSTSSSDPKLVNNDGCTSLYTNWASSQTTSNKCTTIGKSVDKDGKWKRVSSCDNKRQCLCRTENHCNGRAWIGFVRNPSPSKHDEFYWMDGSDVLFTNWNGPEPNDSGGAEDHVQMYQENGSDSAVQERRGKWNDISSVLPHPSKFPFVSLGTQVLQTSYVNDYDQTFDYKVPSEKAVCGMASVHSDSKDDRRFRFYQCALPVAYRSRASTLTLPYTPYDLWWDRTCNNDSILTGIWSKHDNSKEDRQFRITCSNIKNTVTTECEESGYQNDFDAPVDFKCPAQKVLVGISSTHDNHDEDRRWRFKCCKMQVTDYSIPKRCAPYKREKQALKILSDTDSNGLMLVPGVNFVDNLHASFLRRYEEATGYYEMEGDKKLIITGTQSVSYRLNHLRGAIDAGFIIDLEFMYGRPFTSSCFPKVCFLGSCKALEHHGAGFSSRLLKITYHPTQTESNHYLAIAQHCEKSQSGMGSTVATWYSNFKVKMSDCPQNSVFVEDVKYEPKCRCKSGYRASKYYSQFVEPTDTCIEIVPIELSLRVGNTWSEGELMNAKELDVFGNSSAIGISMLKQNGSPTDRTPVSGADGLKLEKADPRLERVNGLASGRRYFLEMAPLDDNGNTIVHEGSSISIVNSFVTPCTCDVVRHVTGSEASDDKQDITGTPQNFQVTQENGHVMFEFKDNSFCEDSFAFTRQVASGNGETAGDETKQSFTSNFYFYSRSPCSRNPVRPGRQSSDDLRISKLNVGQTYNYCVRATAASYMNHPEDPWLPSLASSNEACANHKVRWEASIHGKVRMKREAGGLPVANAKITWKLLDLTGEIVTGPSGEFVITFNEDKEELNNLSGARPEEFPVYIMVSKQTVQAKGDPIDHTFLCDNESIDCSAQSITAIEQSTKVYLRHMQFEEEIHIVDATTAPIRGKIVIGNTEVDGSDGCPIIGAEVCLSDKSIGNEEEGEPATRNCVESDGHGRYAIGAVIGTRVGVEVYYHDHTFELLNYDWDIRLDEGLLIEDGQGFEDIDFKDMSTAPLRVEVAGGLCNLQLGKSRITLSVSGGCTWTKTLEQDGWTHIHTSVPAHILDLEVSDVYETINEKDESIDHIKRHFLLTEKETVDLLNVTRPQLTLEDPMDGFNCTDTECKIAQEEDRKVEEEKQILQQRVRFQYDGELETRFMFVEQDTVGNCTLEDYEQYSPEGSGPCDSLHVIKAMQPAKMALFFHYRLKDDLFCDVVDKETVARLQNDLGPSDQEISDWQETVTEEIEKEFSYCRDDGGCAKTVQSDEDGRNSYLSELLLAGPPQTLEPFLRKVTFSLDAQGGTFQHQACFLLDGAFALSQGKTVSLPTHKPLMVIRDPPGSLSYASYQNIQTQIQVESSTHEVYSGVDMNGVTALRHESHIGMSLGIGAETSFNVFDSSLNAGVGVATDTSIAQESSSRQNSATFETTWSYETSTDEYTKGKAADAFVVPNLSVMFKDVERVSFDPNTCSADKSIKQQFDIQGNGSGNAKGLSFVTVAAVEDILIPDLQFRLKVLNETGANSEGFEQNSEALQNAIENWQGVIEEYEETNRQAREGELTDHVPHQWFDPAENVHIDETKQLNKVGASVWSSVVPKHLVEQAVTLDNAPGGDFDLEKTNRIQFSGGGGLLTYELNHHFFEEHMDKMGRPRDNSRSSTREELNSDGEVLGFTVGLSYEIDSGYSKETERTHHLTKERERQTSVSFVLGDTDEYGTDDFVVDLMLDPSYGSFIFNTVAGVSRCPHEEGTDEAADPELEIVEMPNYDVLPDEPMNFQVRMTNRGIQPSKFEVILANGENTGGLHVLFSADTLSIPQEISLGGKNDPDNSIVTTISVLRGFTDFRYKPVSIIMRVLCGTPFLNKQSQLELFNKKDPKTGDAFLGFARPCPEVRWSGDLLRDNKFLVNSKSLGSLPVTVFNPQASVMGSFHDMVARDERLEEVDERLEEVRVEYRRQGEEWDASIARTFDLNLGRTVEIDFAKEGIESNYGYATIDWDIEASGLLDGLYEIRVQSICSPVQGASVDFNRFTESTISGRIDRVPPRQYGAPTPVQQLMPGGKVRFEFSEPIDCSAPYPFELEVTVDGLKWNRNNETRVFDKDNLLVLCEYNAISFAFDYDNIDFADLMGRWVRATLTGVRDKAGNKLDHPIKYAVPHATLDLDSVAVSFDVLLDTPCATGKESHDRESIEQQVSSKMGLSTSTRVVVKDLVCDVNKNKLSATINVVNDVPTQAPSAAPSMQPTATSAPSATPSSQPSASPSDSPTKSSSPTSGPTLSPTQKPTKAPNTGSPTENPTSSPTAGPTVSPSSSPTSAPSSHPTETPTADAICDEMNNKIYLEYRFKGGAYPNLGSSMTITNALPQSFAMCQAVVDSVSWNALGDFDQTGEYFSLEFIERNAFGGWLGQTTLLNVSPQMGTIHCTETKNQQTNFDLTLPHTLLPDTSSLGLKLSLSNQVHNFLCSNRDYVIVVVTMKFVDKSNVRKLSSSNDEILFGDVDAASLNGHNIYRRLQSVVKTGATTNIVRVSNFKFLEIDEEEQPQAPESRSDSASFVGERELSIDGSIQEELQDFMAREAKSDGSIEEMKNYMEEMQQTLLVSLQRQEAEKKEQLHRHEAEKMELLEHLMRRQEAEKKELQLFMIGIVVLFSVLAVWLAMSNRRRDSASSSSSLSPLPGGSKPTSFAERPRNITAGGRGTSTMEKGHA